MGLPRIAVNKNVLGLGVAIAVGGLSFWGAQKYLTGEAAATQARLAAEYEKRPILVANSDLEPGTTLTEDLLASRGVPKSFIPSGSALPDDLDKVLGQRLLYGVRRGDPIAWSVLEQGSEVSFSTSLEAGKRAITFPVDEVNSFSGLLVPGDVIDLLFTHESRGGGSNKSTVRPILQQVRILATGTMTRKEKIRDAQGVEQEIDREFATVTLHVQPDEAQRIILAQRTGDLTAVLRNPNDTGALPLTAMHSDSLAGGARVAGRRGSSPYVEMIVGGGGVRRSREAVDPRQAQLERLVALAIDREEREAGTEKLDPSDVRSRLRLGGSPSGGR
jgi:pilus assembly protein CpaB